MYGHLISAAITPFNEVDQIDYRAFYKIINHLITTGSQSILIGGSTGEGHLLTLAEKLNLLQAAILFSKGRAKIIAYIGENSTKGALELLSLYNHLELDGILVSPPSYVLPNQEGIIKYYKKLNSIAKIPLIIYNIPKRVGVHIKEETVLRIRLNCPKVIAIKDASGSIDYMSKLKRQDPNLLVYTGNDSLLIESLENGLDGVISVGANAFGEDFSDVISECLENQISKEQQHYYKVLVSILDLDTNPIVIKYIMTRLGLCKNYLRLPLCPLSEHLQEKVNLLLGF